MATVSPDEAARAYAAGEVFLDLRSEAQRARVPLERAVPVASVDVISGKPLPAHLVDGPTYLVCAVGSISELGSLYLREAGVEAYSVRGGAGALVAALAAASRDHG